ncbi:MAG TPA: hypothetical protein VGO96_15110 [Pyrinomonadaceae bacterium]|jgi:hypothetical protein|nr:hypothetical protein [Pyrinomonadaceae bacterium]
MELDKEQKLEQLERVLQSRTLQNSESLKAFLRFVVEKTVADRDVLLKEYTIATEVFGRNSDYDPRIDSVVRVQAGRLRTKLQEYYTTEGKGDPVIIDLPKGHYHPVFNCSHPEAVAETTAGAHATVAAAEAAANGHKAAAAIAADEQARSENIRARGRGKAIIFLLGALVVLLGVAVLLLYNSNRELRRQVSNVDQSLDTADFKAVWAAFVDDPESPLLVLSNPTVYRFLNEADPGSLERRALQLTPEQTRALVDAPEFRGQWTGGDSPRLIPSLGMYTGMGEAIGLYRLTDLFRTADKAILLRQSRHVSAADLKYRNVILLGSIYVNEWTRRLPTVENFNYTFNATIENRDPQAGEEREYKPHFNEQTGQLAVDYALITVKPNVSGEHAVMTLAGIFSEGTEAAAEFVTTRNHLAVLGQRLRQLGGQNAPPKYYQALLKVEVENGTPTTITLITLRALPETQ